MKLKFWGYNEKNMGFYSTPKKFYLDENPIGTSQFRHIMEKDLGKVNIESISKVNGKKLIQY